MPDKAVHSFNIIKVRTPAQVTLANGVVVKKPEQKFWIKEMQGFISAAPYDNHFIFKVPKEIYPSPSYMCSCGSMAIYVGSTAYAHLGSAEGLMFVCQMHMDFNKHADGAS
jgi:hypothetical protein